MLGEGNAYNTGDFSGGAYPYLPAVYGVRENLPGQAQLVQPVCEAFLKPVVEETVVHIISKEKMRATLGAAKPRILSQGRGNPHASRAAIA
jgi:hypothetical protein